MDAGQVTLPLTSSRVPAKIITRWIALYGRSPSHLMKDNVDALLTKDDDLYAASHFLEAPATAYDPIKKQLFRAMTTCDLTNAATAQLFVEVVGRINVVYGNGNDMRGDGLMDDLVGHYVWNAWLIPKAVCLMLPTKNFFGCAEALMVTTFNDKYAKVDCDDAISWVIQCNERVLPWCSFPDKRKAEWQARLIKIGNDDVYRTKVVTAAFEKFVQW